MRTFAERLAAGEIQGVGGGLVLGVLLAEVEFRLEFGGEFDDGGKGPAHFAAEPLQGADDAFGDQFLDFGDFHLAAGDDFPEGEVAFLALEFFVILLDDAAAFRAGGFQFAEIAGHGVAFIALGLGDDSRGSSPAISRMNSARPNSPRSIWLSLNSQSPVSSGEDNSRNVQPAQKGDEGKGLGRGLQFAAVAQDVLSRKSDLR